MMLLRLYGWMATRVSGDGKKLYGFDMQLEVREATQTKVEQCRRGEG